MNEVEIHAIFESRNGARAEAVRVDQMTREQFAYVQWFERQEFGRYLVAIIGQESSRRE